MYLHFSAVVFEEFFVFCLFVFLLTVVGYQVFISNTNKLHSSMISSIPLQYK